MSETANPSGTVSGTVLNQFTAAEATGTFGTMDRGNITEIAARTRYLDTSGALVSAVSAYIGDNANANITLGLTINQGANDDNILALKSSDVAHGVTTIAETDTFAYFKKISANDGGVTLTGLSEGNAGVYLTPIITTAVTLKSTSGAGAAQVDAYLKNGTGVTAIGADGNLFSISNNGTVRFICDAEGSGHADVEWTTF